MENQLTTALSLFTPITLEEMEDIRLMNRLDTKFVTTEDVLFDFISRLNNRYRVQEVDGENLIDYRTVYLDTPKYDMYLAHQNGRKVREKIRVRTYVSSGLTFLEIKNKDNHGRTDKKRTRVDDLESLQKDGGNDFLLHNSWYSLPQLSPLIRNNFRRITLVDNAKTERLTIDMGISFKNLQNGRDSSLGRVVIIELKRDGRKVSYVAQLLHELYVHPVNISKYCAGVSLTDPVIKHNRFKSLLMQIHKINGNTKN